MHIRAQMSVDHYINACATPLVTQDLSEVQAMHEVEWSRSEKYSLRDLALAVGFMMFNADFELYTAIQCKFKAAAGMRSRQ